MIVQPIETQVWRRLAVEEPDAMWKSYGVLTLLDALDAAEHRATRAEAQAAIRGRAVAIYQQRARTAEVERDYRKRENAELRDELVATQEFGAKMAHDRESAIYDLVDAEARIKRLENRAASETIRADAWRDKHRVMTGKRDAAHRAYQAEREARREAEARIKAVRELHRSDGHDPDVCGEPGCFESCTGCCEDYPCATIRELEG